MPYLRGEQLRELLTSINNHAGTLSFVFDLDNENPPEIEQLNREIREDLERQVDCQIGVLLWNAFNKEQFRWLRLAVARRIYSRLGNIPNIESWRWPGINIPIEVNPTQVNPRPTWRFLEGDDILEESDSSEQDDYSEQDSVSEQDDVSEHDDFPEEDDLMQWCVNFDDRDGPDGLETLDDPREGVFVIDIYRDDPFDI